MPTTPSLVVVRGPSGSGKSSLARSLRAARAPGPLAVVGQDVVRRTVLGTGDDVGTSAVELTDLMVRHALASGFDVVLEGILDPRRYGDVLRALRADHQAFHAYLYDLSFEETVARHGSKTDPGFTEVEMRQWWRGVERVPGLDEVRLDHHVTLEAACVRVLADAWPGQGDDV